MLEEERHPDSSKDLESGDSAPETFETSESFTEPNEDKNSEDGSPSSTLSRARTIKERTVVLPFLVVVVGMGVGAAFVALGVMGAWSDQRLRLEKQASDLAKAFKATWNDYKLAALWIHEGCRSSRGYANTSTSSLNICSRQDFRGLYDYLTAGGGLEFQSIAYAPNVTHEQRSAAEEESRDYYRTNYPSVNYTGFMALAPDPNNTLGVSSRLQRSPEKAFYFPEHLIEPVEGNEHDIDFDIFSAKRPDLVERAVTSWETILSIPVESPVPGVGKYVYLLHPGVRVSTAGEEVSTGLSSITIPFPALFRRARTMAEQAEAVSVYIYDYDSPRREPVFFGGGHLVLTSDTDSVDCRLAGEISLSTLRRQSKSRYMIEHDIPIEHQTWKIAVVAHEGTYQPDLTYVILGGVLIVVTSCCVALWFHSRLRRAVHIQAIRSAADSEKAQLIVDSATKAAQAERELNEYLAHEVRNPLSAAISACSFLEFSHQEPEPIFPGDARHQTIQDDIRIISSSLGYINDLLRSILDMQKAANKQVKLSATHTDVMKDILKPVQTILFRRGAAYDIVVECPDNLVVVVDRIRLKQVVLNLASNATKFVQEGFIRLKAQVIGGKLQISIEDSGPGIPVAKRENLFSRFQESLDSLNQGTGMGLSLSENLVQLMGGEIFLDETFRSGVSENPGARFVIKLGASPVDVDTIDLERCGDSVISRELVGEELGCRIRLQKSSTSLAKSDISDLPEKLSVLIVDDDLVLRKLLSRSLKRVASGWTIQEAANGEIAIELATSNEFDIVFLDQYMASVDKQLLGTETATAMRARGVESRICGLSANNLEDAFLKAGANYFLLKPFRCEKEGLIADLLSVLNS